MPIYQDYMARAEAQLAQSPAMDQRFERIRQQDVGRYQEKYAGIHDKAFGPAALIVVGAATASSRFRRFLGWLSLISMAFGAFMGIAVPGLMGVNPQGGHNPYTPWILLTMMGFFFSSPGSSPVSWRGRSKQSLMTSTMIILGRAAVATPSDRLHPGQHHLSGALPLPS